MKRTILTLLAMMTAGTLLAQEVLLQKDDKVVNLGIGIGTTLYTGSSYKQIIPPFSASFELGYLDNLFDVADLNLGLGAYLGLTSAKYEYSKESGYEYSYIIVAGRAMLHYPFVDKLDTYTGLMLGARIVSSQSYGSPTPSTSESGVAYSWFLGGRYYFTDNIAGMAELGYGVTYLNLGVAFKF